MANPYVSEIQLFAFPFPPKGWALCNGATMSIATNQALFALLGTTFGGNGTTTFNLPDLRGRTAIGYGKSSTGSSYAWGQVGGEEAHSLTMQEMPAHNHIMQGTSAPADQNAPNGSLLAGAGTAPLFSVGQDGALPAQNFIAGTGMSQGHPNIQPYLVLNYCISLNGIFPPRN
jgi:microcystin-dependent protein